MALVLLVVIGIEFILHSNTAHQYILRTAQQKVTSSIGSKVELGNYVLNFSGVSPTLDLYHVVVAGAEPYPDPPLLRVDHLRIGVRVLSVLNKKWYLSDVIVDHPVAHVYVDKQGQDNLPQTRSSGQKSNTSLFDLAVSHAVIDRGEVYYNNQKSVMDADLHDVEFRSSFDSAMPRYSGTVAYTNGHLKMESFSTIAHDLRAEFEYAPNRFVIKDAVLRSGPSHVTVNATLEDFSHPRLSAEYVALLDTGEFRQILKNPTLPTGQIDLNGKMQYIAQPNRPMLQTLTLKGSLASRGLQVRTPTFRGEIRNIGAKYSLADGNIEVRNLHASVLGGDLNGALTMRNIADGASKSRLTATIRNVSLAGVKTLVSSPALQKIGLRGSANADADATWGKSFNDLVVRANATLQAEVTPSQSSRQAFPASGAIHGIYSAAGKQLALTNSSVRLPQTSVLLNGTLSNRSRLQVQLQVNNLHELEAIGAMFQASPKPLGLYGTASFDGALTGTTVAPRLMGRLNAANLRVKGSAWRALRANVDVGPSHAALLDGELDSANQGRIAFNLRAGLNNWSFTNDSPFDVTLNATQLNIANLTQLAGLQTPVSGVLAVDVKAHGTPLNPRVIGKLNAANLQVRGSAWRALRTNVDVSPSQVALLDGELDPANQGRIAFSLRAGLKNWSFTNDGTFDVTLNAKQLNIANLILAAGLQTPVSGTLAVDVKAHGTPLNPVGNGNIELSQARIAGEPIQVATVKFQGTGDAVHTNLAVRMPAGAASGVVDYFPKQQGYNAEIQANGIRLDQLQTVKARKLQIGGVLNLTASGRGTIRDPQLVATAAIPKLTARAQTISGITLQTNVANRVANVALDSQVINTTLRGRATVNLTGDYPTVATLDTQAIPLEPLVAAYAPSQAGAIKGQTELHANLRGPLKNKSALEAHVVIPVLSVNYKDAVQIGAPQPINIDYADGVLNLRRTELRGTGTDLQIEGRIPVVDKATPVSLLLKGTVDLQLAQILNPDLASSGQLQFDINSFGQLSDPNVQGQIRVVNATLATGDAPLGLQNGNGVLTLTRNRLDITRFEGTVGGGRLIARGGINYRPAVGFDLALTSDNVRLLYPAGIRSSIGAKLTLTGTPETAYLQGQVNVDQLSLTPDFDLADLMGQFGGTSAPPSQDFSSNLQLAIAIRAPQGINVVSRELSLQGSLNLNAHGTAAEPVLLGRVNVSSGDLIFRGNRYVIQSSTVDFVNPVRTEPVVNAALSTTVQQYNISMRFEGPVDRLRTSYTSDPALPPADIINLLAFGETTEAAAASAQTAGVATANSTLFGNLGAESAIASAVSSQVTSRLEKIVGISHLSVDPTLAGNGVTQNPGAVVTIQQRVTSKFFITFSTDITATQRQVVQMEYQLSPRFSLSGTRDQNGGLAVDTKIRRRW